MILNFEDEIDPQRMYIGAYVREQRYEQLLAEYTKVKEQVSSMKKSKAINVQIEKYSVLIQELEKENRSQNGVEVNVEEEVAAKEKLVQELRQSISSEEENIKESNWRNQSQVDELTHKINQKSAQLSSIENETTLRGETVTFQTLTTNKKNLEQKIDGINSELKDLQTTKMRYIEDCNSTEKQNCFLLQDGNKKKKQAESANEEVQRLKEQVSFEEKQLKRILEELKNLQNYKPETNQETEEQVRLKKAVEDEKSKLDGLKFSMELKEKQVQEEREKWEKVNEKRKEENGEGEKLKIDIDQAKKRKEKIMKKIDDCVEEKKKLKEEKKKNHPKDKDTYNQKIIKLESENQLLEVEIDRERKKLQKYLQIKNTYGLQEDLVKLKQELDKLKDLSNPFDAEIKKHEKFKEVKNTLEESIKKLKSMEKKIITEKESQWVNLKEKVREQMQMKTFYERNISHCENKLNEYMKEFPDHQTEKEEKRKRQRDQKAQEKRLKKQEEQQKRRSNKKNKNDDEENEEDPMINLPVIDDDKSQLPIHQNPTYQYGAIGIVVILVLLGFYL